MSKFEKQKASRKSQISPSLKFGVVLCCFANLVGRFDWFRLLLAGFWSFGCIPGLSMYVALACFGTFRLLLGGFGLNKISFLVVLVCFCSFYVVLGQFRSHFV